MNQNLLSRVLEFLQRKMWNKRWQRVATCLAAVAVFGVTYALILPAVTMTKGHPSLYAEVTEAVSGEALSVKVSAEAESGDEERVFVLIAEGEGADLSPDYVFNEDGTCVITDDAGREIVLHRSIREKKDGASAVSRKKSPAGREDTSAVATVDYWFTLTSGEVTEFTLDLADIMDANRFASIVEEVKQTAEEEKDTATASDAKNGAASARASASNATAANASMAGLEGAGVVVEQHDDGFKELLDGNVINDLEGEEDEEDQDQKPSKAAMILSAGSGSSYETAVHDAEKNAEKRGDAQIRFAWTEDESIRPELVQKVGDAYIAVICSDDEVLPEGAWVDAFEIVPGTPEYEEYVNRAAGAVGENKGGAKSVTRARFFDITIRSADGREIQPEGPVQVVISCDKTSESADAAAAAQEIRTDRAEASGDGDLNIVHFGNQSEDVLSADDVESSNDADVLSFTAEQFSVYGVVYTVDFIYGYDAEGGSYEFSLQGGDAISFKELVKVLHILEKEDTNAEVTSEEISAFIRDIESAEFSDESLVKVIEIQKAANVGQLKKKFKLEPVYSSEFTEEDIAKLNEKQFEGPDWVLFSLKPFETEETLTITMKNGKVITVKVTDAQLHTTVISAGGETYEITVTYGDDAQIPDGAELGVREILKNTEEYRRYLENSARELGSENKIVSFARFFDIEIKKDENKIEPKAPVQVTISLADTPEKTVPEGLNVVHFAQTGLETIDETQVAQKEDETVKLSFKADSFSVYGVITTPTAPAINDLAGRTFTISRGGRYLKSVIGPIGGQTDGDTPGFLKGKTSEAAVWQFEEDNDNNNSTYYISTIVNGEKKYMRLEQYQPHTDRAEASLSDDPQTFEVRRVDGGSYRLRVTDSGRDYFLDEHYGAQGDGFAGYWWEGSNGNTLTFNFTQAVLENDQDYMTFVKYDGKYYIVNNDASLSEVEYEDNNVVKVENPMEWHIELGPNGHIWHNYKEMGFTGDQRASDFFRAYLDPSEDDALYEENSDNVDTIVTATHQIPGSDPPQYYDEVHLYGQGRQQMLQDTAVNIALKAGGNTYTVSQGGAYLGVVVDSNGKPVKLAGNQGADGAAEFLFGVPEVVNADWKNHSVNHIDISIQGTANVSVPLAYGNYYGPNGDSEPPIKVVESNEKLDLTDEHLEDKSQLKITTEDIERATITAAREDNNQPIDNAFYITGYSGNVETTHSSDQVRIEGSFLVADMRGVDPYQGSISVNPVDEGSYNSNSGYKNYVHAQRLKNKVEYTVTVVKTLTFKLVDPVVGQLYDEDGNEILVPVPVAFSASFNYWDKEDSANGGNMCPPLVEENAGYYYDKNEWQSGGIATHNGSGMDFKLGGDAEDPESPLVALEITKHIRDENGDPIELKEPVTCHFDIYEDKNATNEKKNSVSGLWVNGYSDQQTIPDGLYGGFGDDPWRTKKTTVTAGSSSSIVFDFSATNAMYYIKEKNDETSLPRIVTGMNGETYEYVKTYIETEYVRRGDQYDDKDQYPKPVHVSPDYSGSSDSYASVPEVAGKFITLKGVEKKEGFLEFDVYNIYKLVQADIIIKKVDDKQQLLSGATFTLAKLKNDTWVNIQENIKPGDEATDTANPVDLGGLGAGTYKLTETGTPDGYIKLTDGIVFEVYEEDGKLKAKLAEGTTGASIERSGTDEVPTYTITVKNTPGQALPATGGPGTKLYTACGVMLLMLSAMMYGFSRRRGERRFN